MQDPDRWIGRHARFAAAGENLQWPLRIAVQMFPTPTARDWRSGCASDETHARNARPLSEHVGGLLNPDWVEWLMGWPIGWTALDGTPAPLLGPEQWDEEPAAIPRTVASQPHRVDRLRCLGNGQVPQCASMAAQLLAKNAQPPTK